MNNSYNFKFLSDPLLAGYKDPNFYCKDVAYEEVRDKRKCCFLGCTTILNYINDRKRDFCYAHVPTIAFILSNLPEEHELTVWLFYCGLERKRGFVYGLRTQVERLEKKKGYRMKEYRENLEGMGWDELEAIYIEECEPTVPNQTYQTMQLMVDRIMEQKEVL